ncbi:hypothetical protein NI17_011365 [Thermobifida halotolerans]|uniref:Uncharacterized protein n=1 Tax=Thermobifida halotolerans TaxID=483545 RepID=A0A399G8I9_9ACTN|nr:hypothetical protein [Thermobifida halotolerans]UOE21638.1 hypothetical protein NI17_011365 [Thermobifida halotolerans]
MRSPVRSTVPVALSLLVLTGCAPLFGPDLEELLLPRNAFPNYTAESVDAEVVRQGPSSPSFEEIEPPECATALAEGRPDLLPEEVEEVAAQTATPNRSGAPETVYHYTLATGDLSGTPDPEAVKRLLSDCFTFTGRVEDEPVKGAFQSLTSTSLPEEGDGVLMTSTPAGGGPAVEVRMAWGQVAEVHFSLVAVTLGADASPLSPMDLTVECSLEATSTPPDPDEIMECTDRMREQVIEDAATERADRFDALLAKAVERLEERA